MSKPQANKNFLIQGVSLYPNFIWSGLAFALTIYLVWLGSLAFLLGPFLEVLSWKTPFLVLWMSFLYTGLFISAHEAMHGLVFPSDKKINHFFGAVFIKSFALFNYKKLCQAHWDHHRYPVSSKDPDYHEKESWWQWYLRFMLHYLNWKQFLSMGVVFHLLNLLVGISLERLLVFWITTMFLSTLQLFYFGTYLPHTKRARFRDRHCARTVQLPLWLSFLTCYHFGLHWEHHEYPYIPWWRLPKIYKAADSHIDRSLYQFSSKGGKFGEEQ